MISLHNPFSAVWNLLGIVFGFTKDIAPVSSVLANAGIISTSVLYANCIAAVADRGVTLMSRKSGQPNYRNIKRKIRDERTFRSVAKKLQNK